MQIHRRKFLSGVSAITLWLFMPPTVASPRPKELACIAKRVHACLKQAPLAEQYALFAYCQRQAGIAMRPAEWLSPEQVVEVTDRTLRVAFRALSILAKEEDFPLMTDGRLSFSAQILVVEHLPIAPHDYGNKEFIGALSRCAHYYLS